MIEDQRFGESAPFSLGVEEELMILDASTFGQVAAVDRILRGVEGLDLPGSLKTELFASVFEINTNVCTTAVEVDEALPVLRRAAAAAAAAEGLAIAAAATHPFARPEAQPIVKEERYVTFVGYGGISVRRQGVQGLHVHVGMPSGDECWRCLEAIVPWLPVVLAMSANSPWFAGVLNGMASNRAPDPRRAAPGRGTTGVRVVRRVGNLGRAAHRARCRRGLHTHLVGRPSASEARHARGARPRPADGRASLRGVRSAAPGPLCDRARGRTGK